MKARVKWTEHVSFVVESGSGHAVVIDGAPDAGGRNLGMRPMEMVLGGAAACTAFDVVWILKRARQPVADCVVDAEAERAPVEPKVFTRIHLKYAIAGRRLDTRNVDSPLKLSNHFLYDPSTTEFYTVEITYEVRIVDADRVEPEPG